MNNLLTDKSIDYILLHFLFDELEKLSLFFKKKDQTKTLLFYSKEFNGDLLFKHDMNNLLTDKSIDYSLKDFASLKSVNRNHKLKKIQLRP